MEDYYFVTKKILTTICLIGFSALFQAHAQLAITEVMTGEANKNYPDWFELHNYGTSTINLTGYSWNDDSHGGLSGADSSPFTGVTIAAGETVIFTEPSTSVTDANDFDAWWTNIINPNTQVIMLNAADNGLGKGGDSVRLWSTNITALGSNTNGLDLDECSDYLVQRVDTGPTTVESLLYDPTNGVYDLLSSNGVDNAQTTSLGDVGSPGYAPSAVTPTITQAPANETITVGYTASFTNAGLGLPPLVFHWYSNNVAINSQTPGVSVYYTNDTSVLTLSSPATASAGTYTYTAIASNGLNSYTNSATLMVNANPTAPVIQSVTPTENNFDAYVGQAVNFSVVASGYPAPVYHWQENNTDIPNETNSQYVLSLGDTDQSGTYSVIVSNSVGSTNVSFAVNVTPFPDLIITEVMSGESTNNSNGDTSGHGDWFELSNYGNFPVNLFGYRVDDSHESFGDASTITNQATIHPGESVVFVQDMTPDEFRAWWGTNLPLSVQIIGYHGSGLGGSGDAVYVWDAVSTNATGDYVAGVTFSTNVIGDSFGFDPTYYDDQTGFIGDTNFAGALSVVGVDGAFAATVGGDIGSPGTVVNLPRIISLTQTNGGFNLSWVSQPNWNYTIQYKTNLTDSVWTTLAGEVMSGNTNVMNHTDTTSAAQRFYRVFLNLNND
jgi:Lamin Tail Domain/Immunoglobulin domain/Immunoglobulin I-set domain